MTSLVSTHGLLLLALLVASFLPSVVCQCYYPDGKTLAADVPCNSSATNSACCGAGAMCLDNGLCFGAGVVSRGSCTDKNWGPECAQYCQNNNPTGGAPLQPCDPFNHLFICGWNSTDCYYNRNTFVMTNGTGVVLRGTQVAALNGGHDTALLVEPDTVLAVSGTNTSSAATSASSAGTASSTSSGTAAPATTAATFTAGQMAGVGAGVGVTLLLALLAAIGYIYHQRLLLRAARSHNNNNNNAASTSAGGGAGTAAALDLQREKSPHPNGHRPMHGEYSPLQQQQHQPQQQYPQNTYTPTSGTTYVGGYSATDPAPKYNPFGQQSPSIVGGGGYVRPQPVNEMSAEGERQELPDGSR